MKKKRNDIAKNTGSKIVESPPTYKWANSIYIINMQLSWHFSLGINIQKTRNGDEEKVLAKQCVISQT